MVSKCICISILLIASTVQAQGSFICGMGNELTNGTQYTVIAPSGCLVTEIENLLPRESRDIDYNSQARSRRVVNGTRAATLENFPWIADISVVFPLDNGDIIHPFVMHLCGAAIISEYYLLTAGHCLKWITELDSFTNWTSSIKITVGEFDQNYTDTYEEDFEVETAVIHENYNQTKIFVNDIAVIKLKPKDGHGIRFSIHAKPVCLPTSVTPITKQHLALIGGWGISKNEHDILANFSRFISLAEHPVLPLSDCNAYCGFPGLPPDCLNPGYLCAGHLEGAIDSCSGDSGSPLVQSINGRFTLLGLTSFGHPTCGEAGFPGIYTNVQYFLSWIVTTIDRLAS